MAWSLVKINHNTTYYVHTFLLGMPVDFYTPIWMGVKIFLQCQSLRLQPLKMVFRDDHTTPLTKVSCDPYFWTITNVMIENGEAQQRLACRCARYRYKVMGRWCGCGNLNKGLFVELSEWHKLASPPQMASNNACYCLDGTKERGITETKCM